MKSTHDTIEEVVEEFHYYRTRTKAEVTTWLRASLLRIHQAAIERAESVVPEEPPVDTGGNYLWSDTGYEFRKVAHGWNACRAATLAALAKLKENT